MAVPQQKNERLSRRYSDATHASRHEPTGHAESYSSRTTYKQGIRRVNTEAYQTKKSYTPSDLPSDNLKPTVSDEFNKKNYNYQGISRVNINDPKPKQNSGSERILDRSIRVDYQNEQTSYEPEPITPKTTVKPTVTTKGLAGRTRLSSITWRVVGLGMSLWLLQLFLAIINILAFGLAGAIDAIGALAIPDPTDGTTITILKETFKAVGSVFAVATRFLSKLAGFDLSAINPTNIWVMTEILVFIFGMFMLLTVYLTYKLNHFEPLSGQNSGLKISMVLLAMVGYFMPILNLAPWFIPWVIVIWFRPK